MIEDNGIGIAPAKVATIFEQFVRAHADRDEELGAQGLGLGLAIVRECMEAMNGTVTVTLAGWTRRRVHIDVGNAHLAGARCEE